MPTGRPNDEGRPDGGPRAIPELPVRDASAHLPTTHHRAGLLAQIAVGRLLELERALHNLVEAGDSRYTASTIWLAAARIDRSFAKPYEHLLEEWDLAA